MLEEIHEIPTLPQVTVELIRHAFEEEPDIQKVAAVIEQDPILTAKLFKTVNSAAFGLRAEVKNVQQAISIVGLETLRSTIISIAVGEYFINESFGKILDARRFCTHSLATAVIMNEIAQALGIKEAEQLFLVGLLHDLGKIVLDTLPNSNYEKVLERVRAGVTIEDAEKEVFGFNNLQVWQFLARQWAFPDEIIERYKGQIQGKVVCSTLKLTEEASRMAETLGYFFTEPLPNPAALRFEIIGALGEETLKNISKSVHQQITILNQTLELPAPDSDQVFQIFFKIFHMLSRANERFKKSHRELEFKVEVLEDLTRVFTGIIKSLHGESVAFSVLEALIEGFRADGAFLLNCDGKGNFSGFAARNSTQIDAQVAQIEIAGDELSPTVQQCIENRISIKLATPIQEELIVKCLGDIGLAWLSPIYVRGRFTSLLGLGVKDGMARKFKSNDFGKILDIIAGEVGLSMENSRLYFHVQKEARTDSLTSISNRRTIMKILASEFARYKRKAIPLTVAIFDMDHFKAINDNRGHLAGDEFLMKTAQILKRGMRESDYIGRYGGDEFIAIFPDTNAKEAKKIVERIRVDLLKFCNAYQGPDIGQRLSVSAGVASAEKGMSRPDDLILLADKALYKAKDSGRNLCLIYGEPTPAGRD